MTTWASIASNELLTRQDIEDNINNGTFARKSYFDLSGINASKTVTKDEVDAYIYFTPNSTYYTKTGNQEIAKRDITTGSAPQPDRYFLTLYVNCSATGTTTTANLGGGVNPPQVNQFVTISGNSGCWKVTGIDQSSSVSSTINGAYGSDCACGYVVPNRYFLTRYSSCTPTSDTTTADLASGLSVPSVNTFVNITGLSGCWKVISIDQSTSVSYTITNLYGTDCACSQPSISATSSLSTFATCLNTPSASQTITVSGINLTNNIVVTGDADLEFSLTNGNDFTSSVSIAPASGVVSSRTVYVRYKGTSSFSSGLLVYVNSTGASGITLTTGTAYTYPTPTVTSVTNGSRSGTGTVALSATVSANCTADWYAQSSGGTALATGTLSFTTPSISQTTTYYVQARDTSGNNCQNTNRTAVTATVNAVVNPAPINSGLVFWDTLGTDISSFPTINKNGINEPYNDPTIILLGTMPINGATPFLNYYYFNEYLPTYSGGRYLNWAAGTFLVNAKGGLDIINTPNYQGLEYTLMFYGTLPTFTASNIIHHLWSKVSNTQGWDIIWEPTTSPTRFTFRMQGESDRYIQYTQTDTNFKLISFVYRLQSNTIVIYLYINGQQAGSVTTNSNYPMMWWGANTNGQINNPLMFGYGPSADATYYKGQVRHLLMYNYALTGTEISDIYNYLSTH